MSGGRSRRTAVTTRLPLTWSVASVFGLDERYDPGVHNARMGLLSWAALPTAA